MKRRQTFEHFQIVTLFLNVPHFQNLNVKVILSLKYIQRYFYCSFELPELSLSRRRGMVTNVSISSPEKDNCSMFVS